MIYLWNIYDIFMIDLWYIYDIFKIYLWYIYEILMIYLWYIVNGVFFYTNLSRADGDWWGDQTISNTITRKYIWDRNCQHVHIENMSMITLIWLNIGLWTKGRLNETTTINWDAKNAQYRGLHWSKMQTEHVPSGNLTWLLKMAHL